MGLADLKTLAEISAVRRATPKAELPSRLDTKVASTKDDAKLLREWARYVRLRDDGKCRVCGIKTLQTLELDPRRGEAHHIVSRTNQTIRTDVRNGLHVCLRCHHRFTARTLFVVGTAKQMYQVGRTGRWYLNGNEALTFSAKHPAR